MNTEDPDDFIPPPEKLANLYDTLRELPYMFSNLYLLMQCRNVDITDQQLNPMEEHLLFRKIDEEHTPIDEAYVLSAWSQMWVFAFFELMRTWRAFAEDNVKFARAILRAKDAASRQAVIYKKIAANDRASRLSVDFGAFHRAAMQGVIEQPELNIKNLEAALNTTASLRRMLAEVRTSLAKHEVAGARAYAPAPGYGLISPINGSISWRIVYDNRTETIISRRDVANECRSVGRALGVIPSQTDEDWLMANLRPPSPAS